jgi:alpha-tubulin suppressor-like RCC1 family protein
LKRAAPAVCLVALACSPPPPATVRPPPDGSVALQGPFLATGSRHTCAIFAPGAVRCWGDNSFGQLGRPPVGDPLAEYSVDLGAGRRATAVYVGPIDSCAILEGGAVKCWGENSFGQLGLGDLVRRGQGEAAMGDGLPPVDLGAGQRAVALALGESASCALLEDGMVKCWGDPYQGATGHGDIEVRGGSPGTMGDNLPAVDLGTRDGARLKVKTIAAFDYHSFCAILEDAGPEVSGLKCWGSNQYCELGLGTHVGGRGAEPGTLGDNLAWVDIGTTAAGGVRKATALAAGFQSMCALGDDGVVKCWGTNAAGELGIGTVGNPRSCEPEELGNDGLVALPGRAVAIGARREHTCARLESGEVTCWGANTHGQLGTGDTMQRSSPSGPLVFGDGFIPERLVLGDEHSCAIAADRRVKCWGSNQQGQLGPPATADRHAPGPDLRLRGRLVDAVAVGDDHTCAILAGALKCWGRNGAGQLGLGDSVNRGDQPGQMGDALPAVDLGQGGIAVAVAAGGAHTCAALATGEVKCWGDGGAGQLGLGSNTALFTPAASIALPGPADAVTAGADFSCARLADGGVICWGGGARGQLGSGDGTGRAAPGAAVALGAKAVELAAGDRHACALLEDHQIACWGANQRGQLGLDDRQDRFGPTRVPLGAKRALAVSARVDSTCVLLDGHGITCWGANERGQLGLGDAEDRAAPPAAAIDLGTARNASALALGGAFACALLDTQQAKCWGDNTSHQLGAPLRAPAYGDDANETGDFLAAAVQGGGRTVRAIAAGRAHVCAILDTNDVRCWGDNRYGQLGVGDADAHSLFLNPPGVVDLGGAP